MLLHTTYSCVPKYPLRSFSFFAFCGKKKSFWISLTLTKSTAGVPRVPQRVRLGQRVRVARRRIAITPPAPIKGGTEVKGRPSSLGRGEDHREQQIECPSAVAEGHAPASGKPPPPPVSSPSATPPAAAAVVALLRRLLLPTMGG